MAVGRPGLRGPVVTYPVAQVQSQDGGSAIALLLAVLAATAAEVIQKHRSVRWQFVKVRISFEPLLKELNVQI